MKNLSSLWNWSKNKSESSSLHKIEEIKENASTDVLEKVLDYFIHNQSVLLTRLQEDKTNESLKREMLRITEEQFTLHNIEKNKIPEYVKSFERYIWGYYVLDELINDKNISDIKCYDFDHIRIKALGKRSGTSVKFQSREEYKRFVSMVAVKNQVNISTLNAMQTFTDSESSPDFILRFDICTGYINSSRLPMMQIRKFPKFKYTFQELIGKNVMTREQAEYLELKVKDASGIYITGKGSSGKSIMMNSLLEVIPHDKSVLGIQENEELFTKTHPDMLFQRIRSSSGENRVQYGLNELATNGLLLDVDYFVIGEIKGSEAAAFMQASYTGYQCWATGHGRSEQEGIYKLADNIKRSTSYKFEECLRMLTGIEVVVFMKNFQVAGIAEIKGYNEDEKRLIIQTVDLPKPLPRKS